MKKRAKPTSKQSKAMNLIREGIAPTVAMKQAGYSEQTSRSPRQNLLGNAGVQTIIEQYKAEYTKVGITPAYMAQKTKEWLNAKKIKSSMTEPDQIVDDYDTQLKAADLVRKDWGVSNDTSNVKARIVAEEFFQ